MHRFAIIQKDNAQISVIRLWYLFPPSDSPVRLRYLVIWIMHHSLNPFQFDMLPVRTIMRMQEVLRILHVCNLAYGG